MHVMLQRQAAVEATMARFDGRVLAYGRDDCVRLGAFHLRKLKRPVSLAKAGTYSSLLGAAKALKRAGHDSLEAAVDAQPGLFRIPPAAAVLGDLLGLQAADGWIAVFIALGRDRAFGFVRDPDGRDVARVAALHVPPKLAWRV